MFRLLALIVALVAWPQVSMSLAPFNLEPVGEIPESVPAEGRDPGRPPFPPSEEKMEAYLKRVEAYMNMPLAWKMAEFRGRGNRAMDYLFQSQGRLTWYRGEVTPEGKGYVGGLEALAFYLSDSTSVQAKEIITTRVDRENFKDQTKCPIIYLIPPPKTPIPWDSFKSESSHQGRTDLQPVWYVFFGLPKLERNVQVVDCR